MPHSSYSTFRAICTSALALVLGLVTACGSAAPTPPTASPTVSQPVPPTAVPTLRPLAPTATVAATVPTVPPAAVATSGPVVTPTVGSTPGATGVAVNPTVARTAAPAATRAATSSAATAVPKAGALSGRVAYSVVTDSGPRFHTIWTAKLDGSGATQVLEYGGWPAFSPDGKSIAYFQFPGGGKNEGLYVADAFGGNQTPAYINPGVCCINWSRDGNWIVFAASIRPNQPGGAIMMVKADGLYKTVVDLKVSGNGPAFSPDNKHIVYSGCPAGANNCGLMVATTDGNGTTRVVTRDNGGNAQWSPRGDRIVYQASDGGGHLQIFVINADGSGRKQLTTGKGNDGQPIWSRDGGSIIWRSDQNATAWAIMAMNADGSNQRRLIPNVPPDPNLWGWEALSLAP